MVVDNALIKPELADVHKGLQWSLQQRDIRLLEVDDLESAALFQKLSSTNGSGGGGFLDVFHDAWKIAGIATHPKAFAMTQQRWKAACDSCNQKKNDNDDENTNSAMKHKSEKWCHSNSDDDTATAKEEGSLS